jgi:hypothetical protein
VKGGAKEIRPRDQVAGIRLMLKLAESPNVVQLLRKLR